MRNLIAQAAAPQGHSATAPAELSGLEQIFTNVIALALGLGAIILFILLLKGGLGYITSGGSPDKASAARNTITFAIAGVVLLAVAFLILRVIASLTGVESILNFRITQ